MFCFCWHVFVVSYIPSVPGLSSLSPAALTCSSLLKPHASLQPVWTDSSSHLKTIKTGGQIVTVFSYLYQCLNLVKQDGFIAELHQRFGNTQSEWAQPRPIPSHQDQCLHTSNKLGLGDCSSSISKPKPEAPENRSWHDCMSNTGHASIILTFDSSITLIQTMFAYVVYFQWNGRNSIMTSDLSAPMHNQTIR